MDAACAVVAKVPELGNVMFVLVLSVSPSVYLPVKVTVLFAPFATVGIGGGYYPSSLGAYVPLGLGLQTNFNSQVYLLLQADTIAFF